MKFIFTLLLTATLLFSYQQEIQAIQGFDEYLKISIKKSEEAEVAYRRDKGSLALEGIDAANKCLAIKHHIDCVYYRAVNTGFHLETKLTGFKKELEQMVTDFETVIREQPSYDQGGSYRALGYLFLKLPLSGIGGFRKDLEKANQHSQQALKIAPDNLQNLLLAGEIALKTNRPQEAQIFLQKGIQLAQQKKLSTAEKHTFTQLQKFLKKTQNKL